MEIIFLGTSGCVPTEKRNLPAVLLDYLGQYFLFDCGEGTQRQMRFAKLNFMNIDNVFITHLHADHFLGLGGMIQSMDFMDRTQDLNIYGPAGIRETIDYLLSTGTFILDKFEVKVTEVSPGPVTEGEKYAVTCAKTDHTANSIAYCFEEKPHRRFLKQKALDLGIPEGRLFSELQEGKTIEIKGKKIHADQVLSDPIPGRKMVYTGDTRACDTIIKFAENADILIHDATFSREDEENTKDAAHATASQAAEAAKKANVKLLYLTHISQRYTQPEKLQQEAREIFPESHVAEDLMRVKIPKHW